MPAPRRFLGIFAIVTLLLSTSAVAQDGTEQKSDPAAKDERLSRETPEGTLRIFTLGVMATSEELIKLTALPMSPEELALFTKPKERPPFTFKVMKEMVLNMNVRALKPGDKFTLPGKKEIVVGKEEVTEDRMVLVLGDAPVPTRMYKAKGSWGVDPEPLIHARKSAARANERQTGTDK